MKTNVEFKGQVKALRSFPSVNPRIGMLGDEMMFTYDVTLAIMPIGGRSRHQESFSVSLGGDPDDCEIARRMCNSVAQIDNREDEALICDTVESIATLLLWQGSAAYEIVRHEDDPRNCVLRPFTVERLHRFPYLYVQSIPKADRRELGKWFVFLPARIVWYLSIPSALGGTRKYKKMLHKLKKHSPLAAKSWLPDMIMKGDSLGFSFTEYRRSNEVYCAKVTKSWGWSRRDLTQEYKTDFFAIYREITMKWAQAVLREYIIHELNSLFERLSLKCEIALSGLPTAKKVLDVRSGLLEGEVGFTDAIEAVSV